MILVGKPIMPKRLLRRHPHFRDNDEKLTNEIVGSGTDAVVSEVFVDIVIVRLHAQLR